jgi:ABC-type lipoprotein release transport system permease subunit
VARPARARATTTVPTLATHPTASSGLALGASRGRRRSRRLTGYGTAAIALVALVVTLVASAVSLSDTPSRYGFDWDVLALTPYGDHTPEGLRATFRDDPDVEAATAYTSQNLIVDGVSVPGLAATPLKGTLGPTIVEGRGLRAADEIIVGRDTIERLDVDIGDEVQVPGPAIESPGDPPAEPLTLRVVGVATFPSVNQVGTDQPRLGTGVVLTRDALDRLVGPSTNQPEWTAARLRRGVTPREFIARNRDGIPEVFNLPTVWYTDAKPAELRQLDAVRSLLVAAIAISVLIAVVVIGYGLWTQTRGNRRELASLGAIGFTRRQLGEAAAWQAVPLAVIVTVIGIPLGIFVGRWGFLQFARSLAVVERVVVPPWVVAALVVSALAASGIGALCAAGVARRTRIAALLRGE